MYLIKVQEPIPIHGVDYTKGLEDGRHCGVRHPYQTRFCRPILYKREDCSWAKEEELTDYNSLTDQEKFELGEPLFWGSPLHRALSDVKIRNRTVIAELDVQGRVVAEETRVREEFSVENR